MKKTDVTRFFKSFGKEISKHSPAILTGIGVAGMVTTTILAVRATPKAIELIEEEKSRRIHEATIEEAQAWSEAGGVDISPIDYVKICWKPYIPAAATGIFSIACIMGASSVNARRNAALATAYKLSETALTEFKEKTVEVLGERKEKDIKNEIAKDKIESNPVSNTEVIITGKGETLFYDPISGRYFESDIEKVRKAVNDLNWQMGYGSEMYVSLSQLYDKLGLKHTKYSDYMGWRISDGNIEPSISSQIADDGRPCLVLDYLKAPTYDFDSVY